MSICEHRSDLTLALDADENENGRDNNSDDAFKVAGKPNNGVGTDNRSKDEISIADSGARRRSKQWKQSILNILLYGIG